MARERVPARGHGTRWRKSYFFPIPVVWILLATTVLANHAFWHTSFLVFDDGDLRIEVRVSNVLPKGDGTSLVSGFLRASNDHSFAILVTGVTVSIASGTWNGVLFTSDGNVLLSFVGVKRTAPIFLPAGSQHTLTFVAVATGNLAALTLTTDFLVDPQTLTWVEVHSDGSLVGPIADDTNRVCIDPLSKVNDPAGLSASCLTA